MRGADRRSEGLLRAGGAWRCPVAGPTAVVDSWGAPRPWDTLPFPKRFEHSRDAYVATRRDGDTEVGSVPCGQGVAAIAEVLPAAEVVRRTVDEAHWVLAARFRVG